MRFRYSSLLVLLIVVLSFMFVSSAYSYTKDGAAPPKLSTAPPPTVSKITHTPVASSPSPTAAPKKYDPRFEAASLFGMNLYLTGLERSDGEARKLAGFAAQDGV